ncbi:MAG: histidine kinase dimerization/phospho-acceptor domain-containing protein [Cellvibrionaceae bacterium]
MVSSNTKREADTTTRMLSQIAHDLRNPLNSISMNAELVKLKLQQSGDSEQVITYLDRILQECKNCGALLESSTDESRE